MKTKLLFWVIGLFVLVPSVSFADSSLADRLSGRILLQAEENGEAWYINPLNKNRYFLGRPSDAFRVMRELGLGVSEKDFISFKNKAPKKLSGAILLRVEAGGEAYYVDPADLRMHFLGRPADAFGVMRSLGLGITNKDLEKITSFNKNTKEKNEENNEENNSESNTTVPVKSNSDNKINDAMSVARDDLLYLKKIKNENILFIEKVQGEINQFSKYYDYKIEATKVLEKLKTQKILIEEMVDIGSNKIDELERIREKAEEINSTISHYSDQLKDKILEYNKNENDIKLLYENSTNILNDAVEVDLKEAKELLKNRTVCLDDMNRMNQEIIDIKTEYYVKVEEIKNKPISSNSIYLQIEKMTDEANLKIDILNNNIENRRLECLKYFY